MSNTPSTGPRLAQPVQSYIAALNFWRLKKGENNAILSPMSLILSTVLNPQSLILNSQSSILNPQSSILNPQSSILNPSISILSSQSSVFNAQSSILSLTISNPLGQPSIIRFFCGGVSDKVNFRAVQCPQTIEIDKLLNNCIPWIQENQKYATFKWHHFAHYLFFLLFA